MEKTPFGEVFKMILIVYHHSPLKATKNPVVDGVL
jgi:hypothetical protein